MQYPLLLVMLIATACTLAQPSATPVAFRPTATLRGLPTATPAPQFPTARPTDLPLPTFTPLPTATPTAYLIQKGDTLLGIAIQYNVSLEALEAANPGINPANLQIGQTVFIPTGSEAAPNQINAPTPLPVVAGAFACNPTPVGSLICLSEFVNTTDQPVANLSVKVTLLNADNSLGDSLIAYAPLDLIPAGAPIPLGVVFPFGDQRAAVGAVVTADSGAGLAERHVMLEVSSLVGETTSSGIILSGTIANPAAVETTGIVVVGTVYNAAGVVTGYRTIRLDQPLAANASTPFSITLPAPASAAKWAVIAQGRTR